MNCSVVFGGVALLLTLFTWLGGGIVAPWLSPWTPWATLLLAELMLVLPERRYEESLFDARRRVWRGLVRDPLMWLSVVLTLFLTIQWLNGATFLEWDGHARRWELKSPAVASWADERAEAYLVEKLPRVLMPKRGDEGYLSFENSEPFKGLPWSFRSDEAWGVLNWFPPVLVSLLAVRHALRKRSKRHLCIFTCVMTSVLAIAGIIQYILDGTFLYWGHKVGAFFFATFGYPNHAACFFPAVMALAIGMLLWAVEHREHTRLPGWVYVITAVLCGVSAILSGSRAGMLFTLAIIGFTAVYVPIRYMGSLPGKLRFVVPVGVILVAVMVIGTAFFRIHAVLANNVRVTAMAEVEHDRKSVTKMVYRAEALTALVKVEEALQSTVATVNAERTHLANAASMEAVSDIAKSAVEIYRRIGEYQRAQTLAKLESSLHSSSTLLQRAITGAGHRVACEDAQKILQRGLHTIGAFDPENARSSVVNVSSEAQSAEAALEARYRQVSRMPSYVKVPILDKVLEEIAQTDWEMFFEDPMLMRSGYQGILALRQLDDYPWFGAGAHSFRWLNYDYIDADNPEEKAWFQSRLGTGQANVHNDTLQFLAEHGWIGFGLMCGCVLCLFVPFMWGLLRSPQYGVSDTWADRCWLNRIDAYAVFAFVATTLIVFHSFIDLVFRSPACMMLYGLLFVCAPGFMIGKEALLTCVRT